MPQRNFRLGPINFWLDANARSLACGMSLRGAAWERFVRWARGRRDDADVPPPTAVPAGRVPVPATATPADLAGRVAAIDWYHTFDFGGGVKSAGLFDHTPILERYRLPASLAGKRVLDVATFDGYWAFEFERRGAREVIALDLDRPAELDWPPARLARATPQELAVRFGAGFALAKEALRSKVQRVTCNVYALGPEKFGMFDVVHAGDFLLHLNSPVRALQNIAAVCSEYALISDVYTPQLDAYGATGLVQYLGGHTDVTWWRMSLSALEQMILDAGFRRVELLADFAYGPRHAETAMRHAVFKAYK